MALNFGGMAGLGWGAKKLAGPQYKRAKSDIRKRYAADSVAPSKSIFGGIESQHPIGAAGRMEARAARSAGINEAKQMRRGLLDTAKSLNKYNKIFGFASLAVMGFELGRSVLQASRANVVGDDELAQARRKNIYSGNDEYFDSRAAFTQRQRAIQVIHNSQMSTRAAMGQEASWLHN